MSFCPNCGSMNADGIKFCCNCGTPLSVEAPEAEQPVQPVAPVAPAVQPAAQPVQPVAPVAPAAQPAAQQVQPVAPVSQPVQSAAPVAPAVQPAYQQPVYPQTAAVQTVPSQKSNGMCTVGLILSIVGYVTFGLTTLFGLIFSIIGLITAGKKNEKGKGKAVAGIILSSVLLVGIVILGAVYSAKVNDYLNDGDFPTIETDAPGGGSSDDRRVKKITSQNWVETHSESYLTFGRKNTFKYYQSYSDLTDYYYTGTYEIYFGNDAVKEITKTYKEYGVTKQELNDYVDRNKDVDIDDLMLLVLKNEGMWIDGENVKDEEWVSPYYGFYYNDSGIVLDLVNMNQATYFTFVPEDDYIISNPTTTVATTTEMTTETTEMTSTTETSEETTEATTDTSYSSEFELVGDSLTGTVELNQGTWGVWTEAPGSMDSYYEARYQRINLKTGTIFSLIVFTNTYTDSQAKEMAEYGKQGMETDDYTGVTMEETKIGGCKAYTVTGRYSDGMYLTTWYFVDNNNKMHYISVEYFDSDIASYEMVRDTYRLN